MADHQISIPRPRQSALDLAPALRSRNFRLFWVGQIVSNMGTFLQTVAENWLIYELTGSTLLLGVVGFVALLPVVPISFLGGLLVDRVPRRKVIRITQAGLLLQAAVFGLLIVTGTIRVWHIIVLDFVMGALYAIDQPARQAFLPEIVSQEHLANAIALNSAIFQVARVVGQAVSGVLIATTGAGGAMLLNAATYLAPVFALTLIQVRDQRQDTQAAPLRTALSEGVMTLWKRPALLGTISLMATVGGLPYAVSLMMPAVADEVLGTNSIGLGLLLASGAVGAVIGTPIIARIEEGGRGKALMAAALASPLLLVAFVFVRSLPLACLLLTIIGVFQSIVHSMATTLVQVNVPDRVRGRVMSLYGMLIVGSPKLLGLIIGAVAEGVGLPLTILLCGALGAVYAADVWILMPSVRSLD
jgi:MFS family permease